MRAGLRGSTYGGSGGKGRGFRATEGDARQMGGSHVNAETNNHTTPPARGGRGRGRGNRPIETKRPKIVYTNVQEPVDDNSLSTLLKANQETHRNMMILHCRQSWEESEFIIGYGLPTTTATPTRHHDDGPAEQGKITPFGPTTLTTRIATARQLKMDSLLNDKTPAKGRDPPKDKGGTGTANHLHKHSQKPVQDHGTGRAKEWKQQHVDDPLDPTVAIPIQGASRGANVQKSRDSEIEDTGQISTGLLPQTVADIGSTPPMMGGLHFQDREVNTPQPPDIIPTSQDPELISTDSVHSPPRQEDSTEPPHQAGIDIDRSPTGNEGLCPCVQEGDTPDCSDKGPRNKDHARPISKKHQTQPRQKVRRTKLNLPQNHILEHPRTHINSEGRKQLPGPAAHEPDGPDSNSATPDCAEVIQTTSSVSGMQR